MVEMGNDRKVICILCERSEETKISGALSTKDYITAHQNCLLFSSGIYCQNSPQFDDLFGFSVDDVMDEVKRGSKLVCYQCKKKGATAGCEVKRCKKSFHYPCAVQEGAHIIEDANEGKYGLFCFSHYQKQRNKSSTDEHDFTKLQTSKKSSKTASSKKNGYDDSVAAGPSACSSDSSSASSPVSSKRKLNINDKEEERPSKRKPEGWKRRLSDNSSDSVENEPNTDMAMFAPLESDLDENANSVPENQSIRKVAESENPTASGSGNQLMDESRNGHKDEDETFIHSDTESESLLPPVENGVKLHSTTSTPLSTASPAHPSVTPVNVGEAIKRTDEAAPSDPEPSMDSISFWRSCNTAGCTEAIFTDFIDGMKDISSRIQSGRASQEEYDLALNVMAASGKLEKLVAKQQKGLQKKQMELQKAAAAMEKVVSAVRR
ncbi:uncharacterized protein phf11 isoform X3 [Scomber scombrus]|uniref:Uncharacterized protein phf11 isoform X3 n=1 Tax=Scomber scombrus TaxID=13677 RepID=A0AAV1NJ70_SCOSC